MSQFDPRSVVATFTVFWLMLSAIATAVWWTRRRYRGFGKWAAAGPALVLSLLLLALRPAAPEWVSMVLANAMLIVASILYFEGAREFQGLPTRRGAVSAAGVVTIAVLAFFLYVVPSLNARAFIMSAYVGGVLLLTSRTLVRRVPVAHRLGLRLTGTMFLLCAVTYLARAVYCVFGPALGDLFATSGFNRAFFLISSAQMSIFPVGFLFLVNERAVAEVEEAHTAEEALSGLSRKLMMAQEEDRARIARALLEDLGQRAAVLAIQLHRVVQALPAGTSEHAGVQQTSEQVADLVHGIQAIAHGLHSAQLEFLGLAPAAAALCRELEERHDVAIRFTHERAPAQLPTDVALCLFRVLQESLDNAIRHSGVHVFEVSLQGSPADVLLQVTDCGAGFDPGVPGRNRGLGLISMKERLALVRGEIQITSRVGAGTAILARVPLPNP